MNGLQSTMPGERAIFKLVLAWVSDRANTKHIVEMVEGNTCV